MATIARGQSTGTPAMASVGEGVDHLDAASIGGVDQQGDVVEGTGGAGRLGDSGHCSDSSDDALLALDGEEHGGRRVERIAKSLVRRHGSPWSSMAGRVRLITLARRRKTTHPFLT
ncbi:hypothetical protein ACFPZI_17845 [Streptomyces chlorus]|uniref:Uncharacterized protein n=1 Tax=Streptomyces chlorus TaxID=887452 RepID=A0ABW1DY77_9ACTN